LCLVLGFRQVIFEARLPFPCWSSFGHRMDAIHSQLSSFQHVEFNHVYREAKCVAHNLAKLAVSSSLDHVWEDDCSLAARPFVLADQLH
jgi:P2-related tail formation protein